MKKIILMAILVIIGLTSSGCATRQPVALHNKTDRYAFYGVELRYIIDVIKNTPEARKVLVEKLREKIEKNYKNQKSTLKYKYKRVLVDKCQYPRGNNLSAVRAFDTMRNNCRQMYNNDYVKYETKKVYESGVDIDFHDITKSMQAKDDSILYAFKIELLNSAYESYTYYVKENGKDIIIFRTSNKNYTYAYVNNLIKDTINENKELKSLNVAYYKF